MLWGLKEDLEISSSMIRVTEIRNRGSQGLGEGKGLSLRYCIVPLRSGLGMQGWLQRETGKQPVLKLQRGTGCNGDLQSMLGDQFMEVGNQAS